MTIYFNLIRYDKKFIIPAGSLIYRYKNYNEIWTSEPHGKFVQDVNEALEFSGYQEGLLRTIYSIKKNPDSKFKRYRIIFANDTLFKSHIGAFRNFLLDRFMMYSNKILSTSPICYGILSTHINPLADETAESGYISTWLFFVEGTVCELENIKFYDKEMTCDIFNETLFHELPYLYRFSIDNWLQPKNLLRGWYQALPGLALDSCTFYRKRYTIFLEHTLPHRLRGVGFKTSSLLNFFSMSDKLVFLILRQVDRLYTNLLKFSYRVKYLVCNKLMSFL